MVEGGQRALVPDHGSGPNPRYRIPTLKSRRGAAMVEMAIVMPLLMLLLMGIMEFGMIMHDKIMLAQGAREGARNAAIGDPVHKIKERVIEASIRSGGNPVRPEMIQVTSFDPHSGGWVPVTNTATGLANSVPRDGIMRVSIIDYPHKMVTGRFFSFLPGYENGNFKLSAHLTMRRE